MSIRKPSSPGRSLPATSLVRPRHGHQLREVESAEGWPGVGDPAGDPHPAWLRNWRSLRAGIDGRGGCLNSSDERARELRDKIAHTPARTLAGLQAQAELISELAWNDVVASTARQLLAGIKRMQRDVSR